MIQQVFHGNFIEWSISKKSTLNYSRKKDLSWIMSNNVFHHTSQANCKIHLRSFIFTYTFLYHSLYTLIYTDILCGCDFQLLMHSKTANVPLRTLNEHEEQSICWIKSFLLRHKMILSLSSKSIQLELTYLNNRSCQVRWLTSDCLRLTHSFQSPELPDFLWILSSIESAHVAEYDVYNVCIQWTQQLSEYSLLLVYSSRSKILIG